jgi:hypothetical protein
VAVAAFTIARRWSCAAPGRARRRC